MVPYQVEYPMNITIITTIHGAKKWDLVGTWVTLKPEKKQSPPLMDVSLVAVVTILQAGIGVTAMMETG